MNKSNNNLKENMPQVKQKPKLWIVSEVFYPEEVATAFYLTEIANKLSESRDVQVITGPKSYQESNIQSNKELSPNIIIHRIEVYFRLSKNKTIQRILRFILISFQLAFKLYKLSKKNEEILVVTNPAPIIIFTSLISFFRKNKLYILVHDVFPENLVPAKILKPSNLTYRFFKLLFDNAYSKAQVLIVLGRDMSVVIEKKIKNAKTKPKIEIIENWADDEDVEPNSKMIRPQLFDHSKFSHKIRFLFAGNIGLLQNLDYLLEAVFLTKNSNLHFFIVGEGAHKKNLMKFVKEKNMANVTFGDSFPREQQSDYLNACDISIVSLNDEMTGLGVPSKTYNILSAGNPILYLGSNESEIGKLVKETGIGWQFSSKDIKSLVAFFDNFEPSVIVNKGNLARNLAENKYSKKNILAKYDKLFNSN